MKKKVLTGILIFTCFIGFNSIPVLAKKTTQQESQSQRQPDFGLYMKNMQCKIKRNWNPPKGTESKQVVILYSLNKKGEVIKISVYHTSGNVDMDNAAIEALKNSAPFGKLPPEFKGDHIDVQFTFDYNVWTKEGKI